MNRWSNYFKALLLFMAVIFFNTRANACSIKVLTGDEVCAPATSQFLFLPDPGETVASATWDFGDATGSDTGSVVTHNYTKRGGPYTVTVTVTYKSGKTCTATLATKMKVYGLPVAGIILPSGPGNETIQCLVNNGVYNKFCFTNNSTPGPDNWPITRMVWNFGDGDTLVAIPGTSDENPCHTYKAEGTYSVSLTVYDSKGCKGFVTQVLAIKVLKEIKTSYKIIGNPGCGSSTYTFQNNTDTSNGFVRHFEWNFGDGSPIDSTDYSAKHTYGPGDTGTFTVSLTIINKLGCKAIYKATVINVPFQWKLQFKDTVCWAGTLIGDATRANPIDFAQLNEANIDFMQWNFGDPASQQKNIAIQVSPPFKTQHQFIGGPGPYNINVHMHNGACNQSKDTCFTVYILGPQVQINLPGPPFMPFPPNDYVPPTKIPLADFNAINNPVTCTTPTFLKYDTLVNTTVNDTIFNYCGAKRLFLTDTTRDLGCTDPATKKPKLLNLSYAGVRLQPNSYKVVSRTIKKESAVLVWNKGFPIPKNAYYPSSGNLTPQQMNDSDKATCKMPDLVRFTNNSVKYRIRRALDDNTYTNVLDPVNSLKDTCLWKNYPYASDSLIYFWKFNDPNGKQCTSTVAKVDWYCNYSTEVAPYHFYTKKTPPNGGCQSVQLSVKDTVTECADSTTMQIKQGPPQPYFDQTSIGYCKMNWDLENVGIFTAKGHEDTSPGFRGFNLKGPLECASPNIQFLLDFTETLPSCGAQHYWLVFDSAQDVKLKPCPNDASKQYLDYGFLGANNDSGWISGAPDAVWTGFPFFGHYWYQENDLGCKTIGVVLQSGPCLDTAWYHDFICFERLDAEFHAEQLFPDSVLVGGTYVHKWDANSLGNSTNFFTPICGAAGAKPGVTVTLRPRTPGLRKVTNFYYTITRREFGDFWYYHKPFWPDTANVSAYCHATPPNGGKYDTAWSATGFAHDSVNVNIQEYQVPNDSNIYSDLKNRAGIVYGKALLNDFPLTATEVNTLDATGSVQISGKDNRARKLNGFCGDTVVTLKALTLPLTIKNKVYERDLASPKAIDTFFLPYPGFYSAQTFVTNMDGCYQGRTYDLIYGHYALFWVQNKANGDPGDSTICVGDTIKFSYKVRYWSTNCPPPPGGGNPPEGCINGAEGGYVDAFGNPFDVFHPWDAKDPIALRKSLLPSWRKPGNFVTPEKLQWNFGDAGGFFGATGVTPYHVYTKPGSYTITMRTTDSTGCVVDTRRIHLVNVVQVKAALAVVPPTDTSTYCAPKSILFANNSQILGGPLKIPHKRVFAYTEKHVSKDCKRLELDTVIVDSLKRFTWYRPDGSNFVRPDTASVNLDFTKNGRYDISVQAEANYVKCKDVDIHPGLIVVHGPEPSMALRSKHAQCYPYTVKVANLGVEKHGLGNVNSIQYNVLDSLKDTILFSYPLGNVSDTTSAFVLPYPYTHGHFRIQIVESDTFYDKFRGTHENCAIIYPAPDSPQIYFTIFPHDTLKISGDTLVCVGKGGNPGHWVGSGKIHGQYDTYKWDMGDGKGVVTVKNDSTYSYAYSDSGTYKVTLLSSNSQTGCSNVAYYKVKAEKLLVNFTTDSAFQKVAKFTFHNHSVNGVQYIWDFGDSSKPHVVTTDTLKPIFHEYTVLNDNSKLKEGQKDAYTFKVTLYAISKAGCMDTFTKMVTFYREFQHYNVFTPNGDGDNDKFVPGIGGETSYSLVIYDRWGNKVYESNESKANWDGKNMKNGSDCPSGTYYYVWKFKLIGGFDKTINGTVTLLRD